MKSIVYGLVLVLPMVVLELVNRRLAEGFPFALFGFLWLLSGTSVALATSIVRSARAAGMLVNVSKVSLLLLVVLLWGVIVLDQLPCFLGVPNCD